MKNTFYPFKTVGSCYCSCTWNSKTVLMGQPRPAQEGEVVFNVLMVDFVFEGWDVCVGTKSTSIISNTNTIFTAFSGRRSMISHNQIQTDIKAFSSFAYKPVCEIFVPCLSHFKGVCILIPIKAHKPVCVWDQPLPRGQGPFGGMARPKTCLFAITSLHLPHADSGHVKAGGCEQELNVNGTTD